MDGQQQAIAGRKMRADGQRNRAAILQSARDVFAAKGADASLDEIARAAGVGNGTLYRHFPTRGALIDAVCHDDARGLIDAAARLGESQPPLEALARWLDVFITHVAAKNIVVESVSVLVAPPAEGVGALGAEVRAALVGLFDRAVADGAIAVAFDPLDLLRAIAGLAMIGPGADWPRDARRLARVIVAGLGRSLSVS